MKQMLRAVLDYIQLHHIVPNRPVLKKYRPWIRLEPLYLDAYQIVL